MNHPLIIWVQEGPAFAGGVPSRMMEALAYCSATCVVCRALWNDLRWSDPSIEDWSLFKNHVKIAGVSHHLHFKD